MFFCGNLKKWIFSNVFFNKKLVGCPSICYRVFWKETVMLEENQFSIIFKLKKHVLWKLRESLQFFFNKKLLWYPFIWNVICFNQLSSSWDNLYRVRFWKVIFFHLRLHLLKSNRGPEMTSHCGLDSWIWRRNYLAFLKFQVKGCFCTNDNDHLVAVHKSMKNAGRLREQRPTKVLF